jgi:hypothetical protein
VALFFSRLEVRDVALFLEDAGNLQFFSLEAGISTFWCRARIALRMRASMSATGSVNLIVCFSFSRPFAPRPAENLRQLNFFVGR